MDQLKAYQLLELEPGASKKEIKEAYARLSKQYHPEENPDMFQALHEAYITLMRSSRVVREKKIIEPVAPPKTTTTFDFDHVENQAILEAQRQKKKRIQMALNDFQILLTPSYRNKNKAFQDYFKNKAYQDIYKEDDFVDGLVILLKTVSLKKAIYDIIIDYYRLRGENYSTLTPSYQLLYDFLEEKRGMKAKAKEAATLASIPFIVFMAVFREIRLAARATDSVPIVVGMLGLLLLIYGTYKLHQALYRNFSQLKAQALTALISIIFHIAIIITDLYRFVFVDSEIGTMVAVFFILLALLWLVGIGLCFIFKKIRSR